MAKSRAGAAQTVAKQEDNESILRWIECKALLTDIWKNLPAVPSLESRRAWALAHGVDPSRVNKWLSEKKRARARKGVLHHPEDGYTLALDRTPEGQSSSSASPDAAPSLDNPSSPSYLLMSSPPPQTPMDMYSDLPVSTSSGSFLDEDQASHPSSAEASYPKRRSTRSRTIVYPNKTSLAIKNEIFDTVPLSDSQVLEAGKRRRIILRVSADTTRGSSKRTRKETGSSKPSTTTAQSKKKRQAKKAPKTEAVDEEKDRSVSPDKSTSDPAGPVMAWPQNIPAGFCVPPYFSCFNPAMAFGTGMTTAQNIPPHSFGNMMYNPFTGAPLFNNIPAQFSTFSGQPSQPGFFNRNVDVGLAGQMNPQFSAPPPDFSFNVPQNKHMDQNFFTGNFQGFQPGMPADGVMNFQNPPEPTMSFTNFLNEPLETGWSYT